MSKDRNQAAREEFAAATARRQFVQAFNAGQAAAYDRFGRGLRRGDTILYSSLVPVLFTVKDIGPDLSPNVPPGVIKIELVATVSYQAPSNQPIMNMVKIGELSVPEEGDAATMVVPEPPEPSAIPPDDPVWPPDPPDDAAPPTEEPQS